MATTLQFDIIARDLASRTFNKVGRSSGVLGKSFAAFGGIAAGALKGAAIAVGAFGAATAKVGFQTAASLEQAQVSFSEFTGSAQEAAKLIQDIKKFTLATPFELPGLVDTAKRLLGVGVSAKELIPTIGALGDTAAAYGLDTEHFNRVTLALSQSLAKGRFAAEEFNQVSEAGIPILSILSRALHKPVPELLRLSRTGDLLAKDVFPKLLAQMKKDYGGAMAKQVDTLNGLWSNLMDAFRIGSSEAIQPLIPLFKNALGSSIKGTTDNFKKLGNVFKTIAPYVEGFINGLTGGHAFGSGPIVDASEQGAKLRDVLGQIGDKAKGAAGFVADLFEKLKPSLGNILDVLKGLFGAAKNFLSPVLEGLKPFIDDIVPGLQGLSDNAKSATGPLQDLATIAGEFVKSVLEGVEPKFRALIDGIKKTSGVLTPLIQFLVDHPAVFKDLAVYVGSTAVAYQALAKATSLAAAAQAAYNKALGLSVLGRAAGILGILALALYDVQRRTGTVTKEWEDAWGNALTVFADFVGGVQSFELGFTQQLQRMADNALKWAADTLVAAATVANALGQKKIASNLAGIAADLDKFRKGVNKSFGDAIDKVNDAQKTLKDFKGEIKLKADIRDLDVKIFKAKKELSDKNLPKEKRIAIKANLADLIRKRKGATAELAKLHPVTVTIRANTQQFYNALSAASQAAQIPLIAHQRGTLSAPRGLSLVGERGPELVSFRGGERVFNAGQTRRMLGGYHPGGGGTVVLNININGPIGSEQQLKNWLSTAIDTLRREGRLRFATR